MALTDNYDFDLLKNEAEQLVLNELEVQLEKQLEKPGPQLCRCNECIVDMAAIALNMVKPLYRFSLLGSQYAAQAMNEDAYADSIRTAVAQAISRVKRNPAHD